MTASELAREISDNGLEKFGRFYSIVRAIVTENRDPENRARIKVLCPNVYADTQSDWLRPFGIGAGKNVMIGGIPAIGESVNLLFEDGHPYYPVWTYGWFGDNEMPEVAKDRYDNIVLFHSKKGHYVVIDDEADQIKIMAQNGSKAVIGQTIELEAKGGSKVILDDNKVSIESNSVTLSGSDYFAVKGEEVVTLFNQLITALSLPTVPNKPVMTPDQVANAVQQLSKILSNKVKLQ